MMNLSALKIDPEFQGKIPPLTFEELNQLEANILRDGRIINPIIVWRGLIVDGHNRYTIAKKHPEIPFTVHEKEFASRYEAIIWICKNQLGRRNLTPEQKKYLIGKQYEAEKMKLGGDHGNNRGANGTFSPNPQNGNLGDYLKSGYAFRNLICSPLPNQVPKMITLLHPWQSHRSYHFENFGFTCNTSLPLVKISGSKWPTEKAGRAAGRDSQIFDRQLAKINGPKWPVEGSQGGTPCPVI